MDIKVGPSSQEGPAEEGGASHPRSTVTHGHIWLKSYLSLAHVEQGSPRVAARRFCWDWFAVVQPRPAAELWVGPTVSSLPDRPHSPLDGPRPPSLGPIAGSPSQPGSAPHPGGPSRRI